MPPTRRRSARDDILRAFAERVARDGYADTSIADVAGDLGLSKGTVVHHFSSKLELLQHVHLAYMQRRLVEAHHIIATLSTPTSQLAAMVYALLKSHRDDRAATVSFLREISRFTEVTTAVRTQRDTYTSLVEGIVLRGIASSEFRSEDASLIALQVFGMCNYAWTWYRPDGRVSIEDIARSYIRTVLIGLGSSAGAESNAIDAVIDQAFRVVTSAPVTG